MTLWKRRGIIVFVLILTACEQKSSVLPQSADVDLLTCQIQVNPTVGLLSTNTAGDVLAPVDFSLLITASEVVQVSGLRIKGTASGNFTQSPGTPGTSHTVVIPIEEVGSHAVEITVQSGTSSAVCQGSIFATAQVVSGPVITAFTANPMQLTLGAPVDFSISVQGRVDSVQVAGQSVALTQGSGTLRVTPTAAGTISYSAVVNGPGGSDSRTVAVNVAPRCELTSNNPTAMVGETVPLNYKVFGGHASIAFSGQGLETLNVGGSSGNVTATANVKVLTAAGSQSAHMDVSGVNGQTTRCSLPVQLIANPGPFSATFMMDGLETTNRMFYIGQRVRIQWSSVGADSCDFGQNYLNLPNTLSGDTTIALPNLAATHVFTCTRTINGVPSTVSKSIGHGIASTNCYINPVTTTVVPIGGTFFFNGRSTLGHLSATVTGANISTYQKGAGNDQFFSFAVTVTGQTSARQVTMNMSLAPGVSATCTATGP
jgi:hypothetical protein